MKYGSLFSGAGLGDFGFEMAGFDVAWQVENNPYARKILDLRWPEVKKYDDIKAVKTEELATVDLITGGFPCQPFSFAGKRRGDQDDRHLWPEMLRIIKGVRPRWIVAENVPGIINLALDAVCADLEAEEYQVWPVVFPSHALGAWHKRDRLWVVAYSGHDRRSSELGEQQEERPKEFNSSSKTDVADTQGAERQGSGDSRQGWDGLTNSGVMDNSNSGRHGIQEEQIRTGRDGTIYTNWWQAEPSVGRVVNGCPSRVDRLKCLGNGQTPCSTYAIGKWILETEKLINH